MFDEAISLLSIWASLNSWLTPAVLFLLLNLMIGTIAVTSGFTSHKPSHHHPSDTSFHHLNHHQPPRQLTRSPSVLQRLKSINLYTFYSSPTTTHLHPPPPQPPPQQQPDPTPQPQEPIFPTTTTTTTTTNEDDESPTLDEIYSRIKHENSVTHYGRQNSDTKPSAGELPVKLPRKMKKSASDKSAFNHFHIQETHTENVGETVVEDIIEEELIIEAAAHQSANDEGVDAKADDFINRFKKQLQLQRNDSVARYKEMVSRTSAN